MLDSDKAIPRLTQELSAARKERRTLDDQRREAERFREARLDGARIKPLREIIILSFLWIGVWLGSFLAVNIARAALAPQGPASASWQVSAGVGPVLLATLWTGRTWMKGSRRRRSIARAVNEEREESTKRQPAEDAELDERIQGLERRLADHRGKLDG